MLNFYDPHNRYLFRDGSLRMSVSSRGRSRSRPGANERRPAPRFPHSDLILLYVLHPQSRRLTCKLIKTTKLRPHVPPLNQKEETLALGGVGVGSLSASCCDCEVSGKLFEAFCSVTQCFHILFKSEYSQFSEDENVLTICSVP